jgi:hypothetical protein
MPNWIPLNNDIDRERVKGWVAKAPPGTLFSFKKPCRSSDQNRLLWQRLNEIAHAIKWGNKKLTPEDWKDLFTSAIRKCDVVPGLEGGVVVLGLRTSSMSRAEMTILLDYISAFAAEHGIKLSDEELAA